MRGRGSLGDGSCCEYGCRLEKNAVTSDSTMTEGGNTTWPTVASYIPYAWSSRLVPARARQGSDSVDWPGKTFQVRVAGGATPRSWMFTLFLAQFNAAIAKQVF